MAVGLVAAATVVAGLATAFAVAAPPSTSAPAPRPRPPRGRAPGCARPGRR
ncbi:hypothetical protein O1L60_33470 [Streptomyces diastatochromogenes]|nr:hypothetical protein [Streptomyces diastatochromogenes]